MKDYASRNPCTWCEGCGDYGIWTAVKRALVEAKIPPHKAVLCYDVGCHGNMADKIGGYTFHGLHGRVIPFAAGAKLANPALTVMAFGGDGASFSEGIGHLVHGIRSHYPIVFVMHNNGNYGLTTGQASALTAKAQPMNSSPNGIPEEPLNSMDFVFSLEPTFVARAPTTDIALMTSVLKDALSHRGFAYVDLLQACPTYNKFMTHQMLLEKCYRVDGADYDPTDVKKARKIAVDTSKRIATGILYRREDIPNFYERLMPRQGRTTLPVDEVEIIDVTKLMEEFK